MYNNYNLVMLLKSIELPDFVLINFSVIAIEQVHYYKPIFLYFFINLLIVLLPSDFLKKFNNFLANIILSNVKV